MYKYQLPKEFGEKWVAALRSGEYKQTKRAYYNKEDNCYCGMGLGFLVGGATFGKITVGEMASTPTRVLDIQNAIIELNDELDKTFFEIADWIEANVEFVESEASHV